VRPRAAWQRSHLANGAPKDIAYQADQQLFPILELLDFRQATGKWPVTAEPAGGDDGAAWGVLVDEVLRGLPLSADGFVRTDENPADDASSLPFSLSTQILTWYVTTRLARVAPELLLDRAELADRASRVREATHRGFVSSGPHGHQWAYEANGRGATRLYADANDVPTAFAAAWGFCRADDPVWRATMRFAFGEANPAYRAGPWGGLGSFHTPGTWPLGDAQEWIVASATGDTEAAELAVGRLVAVASEDGLLPEAYDPETGAWTARHWFAWPAALVGTLALGATAQT
jgi:meiotically up-regulated gene 157 (Mug157) protein